MARYQLQELVVFGGHCLQPHGQELTERYLIQCDPRKGPEVAPKVLQFPANSLSEVKISIQHLKEEEYKQ